MRRRTTSADFELIRLVALAVAMLLVTFLVIGRSSAAFPEQATTAAVDATAGEPGGAPPVATDQVGTDAGAEHGTPQMAPRRVELTDNDAGNAVIEVGALAPGQAVVRCIQVSYEGDSDADLGEVRLYRSGDVAGSGLESYLTTTIEAGSWTGATSAYPSCDGFTPTGVLVEPTSLATILADHAGYETGVDAWDPALSSSCVFRFTFELLDDNAAQGRDVSFGLAWETRS